MNVRTHIHSTDRGGVHRSWPVPKLWELARDLPIKEVYPRAIPEFEHLMDQSAGDIWWSRERGIKGDFRMWDMARHTKLVMEANLDYPIILNPLGGVMDGCHRILKAHILGVRLMVQQFDDWPPTA